LSLLSSNGTTRETRERKFGVDCVMEDNILLKINNISVVYSDVIQILKAVSLDIPKGQIVSLLGSNGAGKTTTLKAVSGILKPENGSHQARHYPGHGRKAAIQVPHG